MIHQIDLTQFNERRIENARTYTHTYIVIRVYKVMPDAEDTRASQDAVVFRGTKKSRAPAAQARSGFIISND